MKWRNISQFLCVTSAKCDCTVETLRTPVYERPERNYCEHSACCRFVTAKFLSATTHACVKNGPSLARAILRPRAPGRALCQSFTVAKSASESSTPIPSSGHTCARMAWPSSVLRPAELKPFATARVTLAVTAGNPGGGFPASNSAERTAEAKKRSFTQLFPPWLASNER